MLDGRTAIALLIATLASACGPQPRAWLYQANLYPPATQPAGKAVVLPYRDARPAENSNLIGMYMLPFLPWGWTEQQVPEKEAYHLTSSRWVSYAPADDFPKALVADLRNAGLFSDASFGASEGDADYAIQGTILRTQYDGRLWSYGLGPAGPIPWLFFAPAATASNTLSVELSCTDRRSGRQILSKRYAPPPYESTSYLYAKKSDFEFPALLAAANREFTEDLRAALR